MTYRVPLPIGSHRPHLDIVDPSKTEILHFVRRQGLAAYEPPTAAAVMALCDVAGDGFVMYDIGSNVGLYAHLAAAVFVPRRVVAFEPAPHTAEMSRTIVHRNGLTVDVVEAAVGEVAGTAPLYFSPTSDASHSLVEGFRQATGTTDVRVVTIDDHVAETALVPSFMKIDVETFELEVLRGARRVLAEHRPPLIIEVLRRKGRDHGVELTEELAGLGYHYYALPAAPTWEASPTIHGLGTTDRDWLLLPEPVTDGLVDAWSRWHARLGAITVERNPRVPFLLTARAAFRRGGAGEVAASARRYARSVTDRIRSNRG
ncbi:MAG: FkbM family methyltransferase [Actinomycetota bacterium]